MKLTADAKKIAAAVAAEPKPVSGGIEVGFVPSSQAWDGRFANNGWMQECARPDDEADVGQRGADESRATRGENQGRRRRHGHDFARRA